ncbi:predicted protein [Coccidioides posadasii str. Silveira]|uniref:Predicted protein n=1 Tax=Coccidioides posadasii (strain RMSCC 757 / Silveira) TaxID=443226 RepID=E9DIM6_COCPS|nr:predicted protein [Coccidioides posadasii str. Silveira]
MDDPRLILSIASHGEQLAQRLPECIDWVDLAPLFERTTERELDTCVPSLSHLVRGRDENRDGWFGW